MPEGVAPTIRAHESTLADLIARQRAAAAAGGAVGPSAEI